jgi:hypothetical protein
LRELAVDVRPPPPPPNRVDKPAPCQSTCSALWQYACRLIGWARTSLVDYRGDSSSRPSLASGRDGQCRPGESAAAAQESARLEAEVYRLRARRLIPELDVGPEEGEEEEEAQAEGEEEPAADDWW